MKDLLGYSLRFIQWTGYGADERKGNHTHIYWSGASINQTIHSYKQPIMISGWIDFLSWISKLHELWKARSVTLEHFHRKTTGILLAGIEMP